MKTEEDIKNHMNKNHNKHKRNKSDETSFTPSSSPPRKKMELEEILGKDDESIEMMDIEIEANAWVVSMLVKRIKELELANNNLEMELLGLKSQSVDFSVKNVNNKIEEFKTLVEEENLDLIFMSGNAILLHLKDLFHLKTIQLSLMSTKGREWAASLLL